MRNRAIFVLAGALSGVAGAVLLFALPNDLVSWLLLGYLFVAALWIATWITQHKLQTSRRGSYIQILISFIAWPLVLLAGILGLYLAKAIALPLTSYSFVSYVCASLMAFALGVLSLHRRKVTVSSISWLGGLLADFVLLLLALAVFHKLNVPRSSMSNHYEGWLCLIVFAPLAVLDAGLYGWAIASAPSAIACDTGHTRSQNEGY